MPRWVIAVLIFTSSCSDPKQQPFDQEVWKASATIAGEDNPRQFMIGSLLDNKLVPGQSMAEVQKLLGSPYRALPRLGYYRVWTYPTGRKSLQVGFNSNKRVTKVWTDG